MCLNYNLGNLSLSENYFEQALDVFQSWLCHLKHKQVWYFNIIHIIWNIRTRNSWWFKRYCHWFWTGSLFTAVLSTSYIYRFFFTLSLWSKSLLWLIPTKAHNMPTCNAFTMGCDVGTTYEIICLAFRKFTFCSYFGHHITKRVFPTGIYYQTINNL